jgi:hypothetical protein
MDYLKGLLQLRRSADNFDYARFVKDRDAGKFVKRKSTAEAARAGLMRQNPLQLGVTQEEEDEPVMGPLAERYLELRKRRKPFRPGGIGDGIGADFDIAVKKESEQEDFAPSFGVTPKRQPLGRSPVGSATEAEGKGLMRPRSRDSVGKIEGDDFKSKLIMSESSGRSDASVTTQDGRTFVGYGQFGEARLKDYMKANKVSFTQDDFVADVDLQEKVLDWHIADIDKTIDNTAGSENFDRDGLRAVAHLGGKGGMRKFIKSGGQYNTSDDFGTSLVSYYNKFSG